MAVVRIRSLVAICDIIEQQKAKFEVARNLLVSEGAINETGPYFQLWGQGRTKCLG